MTDACRGERGSATVLMTAVVAVVALLLVAALAGAAGRVAVVRAQGAADAGAVAGAAVVVGLVPGDLCDVVRSVVRRAGAAPTTCDSAGALVHVVVVVRSGPFAVGAGAVAGPDPSPEHPEQ